MNTEQWKPSLCAIYYLITDTWNVPCGYPADIQMSSHNNKEQNPQEFTSAHLTAICFTECPTSKTSQTPHDTVYSYTIYSSYITSKLSILD